MNKVHIFYDFFNDDPKVRAWERRNVVFEDPRDAVTWIRKYSWSARVKNIKDYPFSHPNKV
jgi:hypothetical protein